jgi:hypothetical protein
MAFINPLIHYDGLLGVTMVSIHLLIQYNEILVVTMAFIDPLIHYDGLLGVTMVSINKMMTFGE